MRVSITKRLALIASIPATLFAVVALASTPAEAAPVATADLQAQIVTQSNVERVANGCQPLTVNDELTTAAVAQSTYMAQSGTFSHLGTGGSSFVTRDNEAGYTRPLAENIAYGFRTADDVVTAWMNSPEHRANLLNCTETTVGVGAVYAADGTPYYTQDFGN